MKMFNKTADYIKRHPLIGLLFIIIFTFLIYFNSLHGEFISDDRDGILNNYKIKDIPTYFSKYFSYKTPNLQEIVYVLNWHFFKSTPFGYHLIDVLFHLLNVILVYFLINLVTDDRRIALLTAAIFSVHTINTETIDWISATHYLILAALYLASFICYIKSIKRQKTILWYLSSLFFFDIASSLRTTTTATMPVLLLACNLTFLSAHKRFKNNIIKILPYLFLTCIYLFLVKSQISERIDITENFVLGETSLLQRIIILSKIFLYYLRLIFLPIRLGLFHHISGEGITNVNITSFFSLILLLLAVYAILRYNKTQKILSFAIIWSLVTFLPFSNIFIPVASVVAERYLYLSCIGIYVLIAFVLLKLPKKIATVLFIFIFGFYSFLTVKRNADYRTAIGFFSNNVKNFPKSEKAYNELGIAYLFKGDLNNAIDCYKKVISLAPEYDPAYHNLCALCVEKGELKQAEDYCTKALELNPNNANVYITLTLLYSKKGDYDSAIKYGQKAISMNPYSADAYNNLGMSYGNKGDYDRAIENFSKAVSLNPENKQALTNLNIAYSLKGMKPPKR